MKKIFSSFVICYLLFVIAARGAELFDRDNPVQDGLNVFEVSEVFADIYEQLDGIKWAGKSVGIAIEALEKIHPNVHLAVTDDRAVMVWKDTIVGNWPRPKPGDWKGYGEITTAIVLRLRSMVPGMQNLAGGELYSTVVSALMRGIDEDGRYIYSRRAEIAADGRLLTSAGIEGARDERGNFRVGGIYKGSAADNAGVKEGDLITDINGRAVLEMTEGDLAGAFAGFNSGTLKLNVVTEQGAKLVILRRASIMMADADIVWREDDKGGTEVRMLEIIIHRVSDNAVEIVNEALAKFRPNEVIMDLRAASGEDERAAAKLGGLFMGRVPILRIVETAKEEVEIIPGGDAVAGDMRIVVLTSGGTSGTAEALAAAFYERGRGVLVGTPTAGRARLITELDLRGGAGLELFNREAKTGMGRKLDGRGVFPLVCLSNIRNSEHREAFFVNILNGDFNARDLNKDEEVDPAAVRKGCPQITSGADEDSLAAAIAAQILTGDRRVYAALVGQK